HRRHPDQVPARAARPRVPGADSGRESIRPEHGVAGIGPRHGPRVMRPTLVIVGRPNVGKSTLFNRLTRTRDALVAAVPGLTRDRHYGLGRLGERPYLVVDTGGLEPEARGVFVEMARQARTAIAEADVIVLVTDARDGLTVQDRAIGEELRRIGRRVLVAVNKAEGMNPSLATLEFHEMGLGVPYAISAEHGEGVHDLVEAALADFPVEEESGEPDSAVRVAIVGRPNAGKSTLVNALVGEERVVTFEEPGTTRDAIDVELAVRGRRYVLVDTAGLRRRGKVFESVEKFSVVKTLQAIDRANVAVVVVHGTALNAVSESYRRYLEADFRRVFRLEGTPLRIEFRSGRNPYVDRRIGEWRQYIGIFRKTLYSRPSNNTTPG